MGSEGDPQTVEIENSSIKINVNPLNTPPVITPPRTRTPPPGTDLKRRIGSIGNAESGNHRDRSNIREAVDPSALSKALSIEAEETRSTSVAAGSPSRKRQKMMMDGDRFIPNRRGQDLATSYKLLKDEDSPTNSSRSKKRTPHGEIHFQKAEEADQRFTALLHSNIFDTEYQPTPPGMSPHSGSGYRTTSHDPTRSTPPHPIRNSSSSSAMTPSTPQKNLFRYMAPKHHNIAGHPTPSKTPHGRRGIHLDTTAEIYNLSPIRLESQRMLLTPRKQPRAVSKVPYKVLDAPDLADDFYLNLVDWGSTNILGVGLGSCVYMWNSKSGIVNKLCDLEDDTVTSVSWLQRGSHLAIGTGKGYVQIWDAERQRRLRTMTGHTARVGALAWNDHILTSGSRDRLIYHRDVRAPDQWLKKLVGHKQEVCGLRWNCIDGQLASGGNDNKMLVWDKLSENPLWKFSEHTAAVKAIAWSPHQHGIIASGGGTADRRIIFRNTLTGEAIKEVDTGSQVCNLAWSKNSNELVSTHGYSQNQIVVWKYPSMTQVVSLTGHTYRVLYLAMSPDGRTIVTGAGDETLRFWNVFGRKTGIRGDDGDGGASRFADWGIIR